MHPLQRLVRMCSAMGLIVRFGVPTKPQEVTFINKTIYLPVHLYGLLIKDNTKSPLISDLVHEIGHYIIAKPGQRRMKNYSMQGGGRQRSTKRGKYEDELESRIGFIENVIYKKLKHASYRKKINYDKRFYLTNLEWWEKNEAHYIDTVNLLLP